jgi:integrase/recombinase XerD
MVTGVGVSGEPGATRSRDQKGSARPMTRGVPLLHTPRTLPRVLSPEEEDAFIGALRTLRDRAVVQVMLLAGCRR